MHQHNNTFIISRTDSIGDVMLTLPMAGILKREFPGCTVYFLGRSYTQPIVAASVNVDGFINLDDYTTISALSKVLAKLKVGCIFHVFPNKMVAAASQSAQIPMRVGTSHRFFHWYTCNYPVNFTRKNSLLHEAELNLKLLKPLGIQRQFDKEELHHYYGLQRIEPLNADTAQLLDKSRFNLVLHPLSKGSAVNWGLANFSQLVASLPANRFKLFVTGTAAEGEKLTEFIAAHPQVTNLTGQLSLGQLMAFIQQANGLVACSTGPLHIAAALGKHAIGLYPEERPMHSGRWGALGKNVKLFSAPSNGQTELPVNSLTIADYLLSLY